MHNSLKRPATLACGLVLALGFSSPVWAAPTLVQTGTGLSWSDMPTGTSTINVIRSVDGVSSYVTSIDPASGTYTPPADGRYYLQFVTSADWRDWQSSNLIDFSSSSSGTAANAPVVSQSGSRLVWSPVAGARAYNIAIVENGGQRYITTVNQAGYTPTESGDYVVTAVIGDDWQSWPNSEIVSYQSGATAGNPSGQPLTVRVSESGLSWDAVSGAQSYNIMSGGRYITTVNDTQYQPTESGSFSVVATVGNDWRNWPESDAVEWQDSGVQVWVEDGAIRWSGTEGANFIVISGEEFDAVLPGDETSFSPPVAGEYSIAVDYENSVAGLAAGEVVSTVNVDHHGWTLSELTLAEPENLSLQVQSEQSAQLSWSAVPEAETYRLYRNGDLLAETDALVWQDTARVAGETYRYHLIAGNDIQWSEPASLLDGESERRTALLAEPEALTTILPEVFDLISELHTEYLQLGIDPESETIYSRVSEWDASYYGNYDMYQQGECVSGGTIDSYFTGRRSVTDYELWADSCQDDSGAYALGWFGRSAGGGYSSHRFTGLTRTASARTTIAYSDDVPLSQKPDIEVPTLIHESAEGLLVVRDCTIAYRIAGTSYPAIGLNASCTIAAPWSEGQILTLSTPVDLEWIGEQSETDGYYQLGEMQLQAEDGSSLSILPDNGRADAFNVNQISGAGVAQTSVLKWDGFADIVR